MINEVMPEGLWIVTPKIFKDERGYFFESFNEKRLQEETGFTRKFIQDNESMSCRGTMRGLHWQAGDFAQDKLVRAAAGSVVDFVLDIRRDSVTFGKMFYVYLSAENKRQFLVPSGFAHGFIALEDNTIFQYKCTDYYNKQSERGINMLDPQLNILSDLKKFIEKSCGHKVDLKNLVISEKDKVHPLFKDALDLF